MILEEVRIGEVAFSSSLSNLAIDVFFTLSAGDIAAICDRRGDLNRLDLGNLRLLNVMAAELLTVAAQRELTQLDEQLFLELYSPTPQKKQPR